MIIKSKRVKELEEENAKLKARLDYYIVESKRIDELFNTKFEVTDIIQFGVIDGYRFARFLDGLSKDLKNKYGNCSFLIKKIIDCMPEFQIREEYK